MYLISLFLSCCFYLMPVTDPPNLLLSADNGQSWLDFTEGLPDSISVRTVHEADGKLYLGSGSHGIYILGEDGKTWSNSSLGLPVTDLFPTSITSAGDRLIIGTFQRGIYISNDSGKRWFRPVFNIEGRVIYSLHTQKHTIYAGTDAGMYHSRDNGYSWQKVPATSGEIRAMTTHRGQLLVAGQNSLGLVTPEGIAWSSAVSRWSVNQLLVKDGMVYALTSKNEAFQTVNGKDWREAEFCNLWAGQSPFFISESRSAIYLSTSRGWIAGVMTGC